MADYIYELEKDLVEQFKDKPNILSLMETVGKQLNDLFAFYEQLRYERDVDNSEGTQLDGIGDIVSLSRTEAVTLVRGGTPGSAGLDDETYRQRLLFKILKNTCNCTYDDIRKSLAMFWKGSPLRYSEDANHPAAVILDFDASPENEEEQFNVPVIKAGGVGLMMRMQKDDDFTIYYGLAQHIVNSTIADCLVPVLDPSTYLTDEGDLILETELGAWLKE